MIKGIECIRSRYVVASLRVRIELAARERYYSVGVMTKHGIVGMTVRISLTLR